MFNQLNVEIMKDLSISRSYGNSLERITDRNSPFGDVSNFGGTNGRSVNTPYTNFKIGNLSTGYNGQEYFNENYSFGNGIPVKRSY